MERSSVAQSFNLSFNSVSSSPCCAAQCSSVTRNSSASSRLWLHSRCKPSIRGSRLTKKSQPNRHKSAYWDSPYFVQAVQKSHTNTHISAYWDSPYFVCAVKNQSRILQLTGTVCTVQSNSIIQLTGTVHTLYRLSKKSKSNTHISA